MCVVSSTIRSVERCATAPAVEGWARLLKGAAPLEDEVLERVQTADLELLAAAVEGEVGDPTEGNLSAFLPQGGEAPVSVSVSVSVSGAPSWVDIDCAEEEVEAHERSTTSLYSASSAGGRNPYAPFSSEDLKRFQGAAAPAACDSPPAAGPSPSMSPSPDMGFGTAHFSSMASSAAVVDAFDGLGDVSMLSTQTLAEEAPEQRKKKKCHRGCRGRGKAKKAAAAAAAAAAKGCRA